MAFVNVEGEVSRLHGSGGGFGLKESWTAKGQERSRFWAVFPADPVTVSVGDRVKVSGGLQTSVTDPKTAQDGQERRYVDHVVGRAKVEHVQGGGSGERSTPPASVGSSDGWNTPQISDAQAFGGGSDEFDQPF